MSAAKCLLERTVAREDSRNEIAKHGIGAGDTPKRQMECLARERVKSQNIKARFNERVIGLANDLIAFAPSLQTNKAAAGSIRPPVIDRAFPFCTGT